MQIALRRYEFRLTRRCKMLLFSPPSFFQYIDLQIYPMNIWMNPFEKSSFFSDDQLWLISIEQGLQADWQAKNCMPQSLHVPQTWKINIYVVSSSQHNQENKRYERIQDDPGL